MRVKCSHIKLKCINCDEDHKINNQTCAIWEKQQTSSTKSDIAMKNSSDFAVVISNKW